MESLTVVQQIEATILAQSWLEVVAVITAILYLLLAAKENIWCWFYGFISTAIYVYIFHSVSLLSESALNVYYLLMAIYGWWQWRNKDEGLHIKIRFWSITTHYKVLGVCIVFVPVLGFGMEKIGASFPYIDAFVAILAVFATYMTTKKIFENWYYWLLVDTISIYLFWQKQMYLTAVLFVIYIVLIFVGIKSWKKLMEQQR